MFEKILKLALISVSIGCVWSDTNYRLNTTIEPLAYSIAVTPYFDTGDEKAFTFDGEVSIKFRTTTSLKTIKLHSEGLQFNGSDVNLSSGTVNIILNFTTPIEFVEKYTFVYINLEKEIPAYVEYLLKIIYKGPIRADLNGFYRNYYIEEGVKKWLGATQMEPTHARKVFPCFDEPELKAVFTLSIDRPENYKPSLANTELQTSVPQSNGYIRDIFYPTPRMSTYLVAFLVSEFEAGMTFQNNTNEFGVYSRPEAANQTEYAFDFGLRVVNALSGYFNVDYYSTDSHLKLDHIALPDFRAGAMENWGLVKYREALLLYVPEESPPYYKYRVAQIIAHETTHMWFGNLVTCHWWSDTWLNEGFANYFQDYITAMIEPEVGSYEMLVIGSVHSALDADDEPSSVPITNVNVNSPAEISGHFGTISYQKAGSVIRMIHHLIGDDAFRFGLTVYLTSNKFESAHPGKVYMALSEGVAQYESMAKYPDSDVETVMSSWVSQAGHPILKVNVDYDTSTITLTQKRFYIGSTRSNEIYDIPITYTVGSSPNFDDTKPAFIMETASHTLYVPEINNENHNWVVFNLQETGLYRVNYDDHSWMMIASALKEERDSIHSLNRAKIINDLFAFLYADEVDFKLLQDVSQFLRNETDYAVWYSAIRAYSKLRNYYRGSEILGLLDEATLDLMDNIITTLGYEVLSTDNLSTQNNRMQVLQFACNLGHQGCIDSTLALFKNFRESGAAIHPSLRSVSYCTGLRFGDKSDYDFLWNRMSTTNVANEARTIGEVLGCTTDKEKLKSYLSSMLVENSPVRTQDVTSPLSSVLSNYSNVDVVLEVLKENMTLWNTVYPSMDAVLSAVALSLHTEEDFTEFEAWLSSCAECSEQALTSARSALEKAKAAKYWADKHEAFIKSTLRNTGNLITSSISLVLCMLIFTINE